MRLGASEHITPYDRMAFSDVQAEALLASGEHRQELIAFFGDREYGELQYLARRATRARRRPGGRVLLIPGIMGSQLGFERATPLPRDLLWVDPVDISAGATAGSCASIRPRLCSQWAWCCIRTCGCVYTLKPPALMWPCIDYDWRLGIDVLGKQLAQRIESEPHAQVHLVAHSMGGLVSRAALSLPARRKVQQVVLLGRAQRGFLCRRPGGARDLPGSCVNSPGLMPGSPPSSSLQKYSIPFPACITCYPHPPTPPRLTCSMPRTGPARARGPERNCSVPPETVARVWPKRWSAARWWSATGQPTVTGIERVADDFVYTVTTHGDGTVPVVSARLTGAKTYYVACAHSELTRDPLVASAVADILKTGVTRRLTLRWWPRNRSMGRNQRRGAAPDAS